jgi:glucose 1-dehydrogenase
VKLAGQVALVTGGGAGIGRGCALALARAGADVAVTDIRGESADAVTAEIAALGRRSVALARDAADRAAHEDAVGAAERALGPISIGVANVAGGVRKPFLELEEQDVRRTFALTLWAPFHLLQVAARRMVARGAGGSLVVISSVHATMPFKHDAPYNSGKAALNALARAAAVDLAPHGIRVNVVEPGWIDTPGQRRHSTEEQLRAGGSRLPLGRLGTIEDIGQAVAYLASSGAAMTGAVLRVDGGVSLPRAEIFVHG